MIFTAGSATPRAPFGMSSVRVIEAAYRSLALSHWVPVAGPAE